MFKFKLSTQAPEMDRSSTRKSHKERTRQINFYGKELWYSNNRINIRIYKATPSNNNL